MASALALNACASVPTGRIPDSLKAPCVSTVDVSGAQTVGDLGRAVLQGDADLAICSLKKDAIVEIYEAQERRPWWALLRPG
jgi:hypothetical protein